jgi:hypothetical protein
MSLKLVDPATFDLAGIGCHGGRVVLRQGTRSAYLHVLNRDHVAAPAVLALAGLRTELWNRIRAAVAEWEVPPVHVSAFGSTARGDGDERSDIDVFVLRPGEVAEDDPRWRGQIDALHARVEAWTGNRAAIIEQGEREVSELLAQPRRAQIWADLERDAIDLAGTPVRALLGVHDR